MKIQQRMFIDLTILYVDCSWSENFGIGTLAAVERLNKIVHRWLQHIVYTECEYLHVCIRVVCT